jgi:hypothetical protein
MKAPDPGWLPYMPWVFGILLLLILAALCTVIGLGKVEQATSFGLQDLVGGLLVLAGGYANSVFGNRK